MQSITLCLAGLPVSIETVSTRLSNLFLDYFRYYSPQYQPAVVADQTLEAINQAVSGRVLRIELAEVREVPAVELFVPAGAGLIAQTGVLSLWEEMAEGVVRYFMHAGTAAYRIEPAAAKISGVVGEAAFAYPQILANTYTLFPLLLLQRHWGRYHLHAAAIVSPRQRLWLICGAQRSGKTTLTTALGLAGWRPISDDSLLLSDGREGWQLEPLRKRFHLGNGLLDRWPELAELGREDAYLDRTCVDGLGFFGALELAQQVYREVDGILLPEIINEAQSRLESVSPGRALLRLGEQSVYLQIRPEQTARQWQMLSEIAREAGAWWYGSGLDLLDDPRVAARLLDEIDQRSPRRRA